ncbi:Stc1 domain-containing protein [Umbelopsis sp. PMI_123]|nr:Stc1 domain-containing protein [Umbelopsis sp. PMI_123]
MKPGAQFHRRPSDHGASRSNQQSPAPATYTCIFCKRNLPAESFSKTQLSKVTYNPWAPHSYNKKKQQICCKQCTPGQSTTLTCMTCTKTKQLEDFAKAQRRNAEKARCLACMQKYHDEDIYDSEEDSDDYGDAETWNDIL